MERTFRKKKSLGQNFLKSKAAIRSIVLAGDLTSKETVLEIGPGKGVLTEALLATGVHVVAVEKDDRLIEELGSRFAKETEEGRFTLIHGDILGLSVDEMVGAAPYKVIANIPYYITGMLFRKFLEEERQPTSIVVLVQKEVADRIVARDKKESMLSISVKAYGTPKIIDKVSKKMFSPQPKVDSAILLISSISKSFFEGHSEAEFFKTIHAGFAQKRKKVIRNLEKVALINVLKKNFITLKISENARAEDLTINNWKKLQGQLSRET